MIKYNSKQRRNTHLYFYMFIYLYFCASIFIDIYIYNKKPRCITAAGKMLDVCIEKFLCNFSFSDNLLTDSLTKNTGHIYLHGVADELLLVRLCTNQNIVFWESHYLLELCYP